MEKIKILINGVIATEEDWELLKMNHKSQNTSAKLKIINYFKNGKMITAYNIITK